MLDTAKERNKKRRWEEKQREGFHAADLQEMQIKETQQYSH